MDGSEKYAQTAESLETLAQTCKEQIQKTFCLFPIYPHTNVSISKPGILFHNLLLTFQDNLRDHTFNIHFFRCIHRNLQSFSLYSKFPLKSQ